MRIVVKVIILKMQFTTKLAKYRNNWVAVSWINLEKENQQIKVKLNGSLNSMPNSQFTDIPGRNCATESIPSS